MPTTSKYVLLSIIFSILNFTAFTQKEASIYYFGTAGLDFRTDPPTILTNSAMDAIESPAVMCDSLGNLLFYTNGGSHPMQPTKNGAIWNKNHQIMQNGELFDTAGCNSSFQGAIFVPMPGKKKQYYLFTKDCIETNYFEDKFDNRGLRYSIIDLNYNNGLGKVTQKGIPLIPYGNSKGPDENVTAVLHENKKDYWVFSYLDRKIISFLVDSSGFHPYITYDTNIGRIIVSPKRNFILFGMRLYKLDVSTGLIEFYYEFKSKTEAFEFSPNGRFIYRTGIMTNGVYPIYQYDLDNVDFENSETFIARGGGHQLSLTPDGKIYNWKSYLNRIEGIIQCPNEKGLNCSFKQEPFYLNGKKIGAEFTQVLTHYLYRENLTCTEPPTPPTPEIEPAFPECPFTVFPNPANDNFTIKMDTDTLGKFKLVTYDLTGRLVYDFGNVARSGFNAETQNWPQGVYILYMALGEERKCKTKITIVR